MPGRSVNYLVVHRANEYPSKMIACQGVANEYGFYLLLSPYVDV